MKEMVDIVQVWGIAAQMLTQMIPLDTGESLNRYILIPAGLDGLNLSDSPF